MAPVVRFALQAHTCRLLQPCPDDRNAVIPRQYPPHASLCADGCPCAVPGPSSRGRHVPATSQTKGMIQKEHLEKMKKGSYFINLARGSCVDIEAAAEALKSGHLAGAAFDVYPSEPAGLTHGWKNCLQGCPNTILTPHIGGSTEEAQAAIGVEVANKVVNFINLGSTTGAVNLPQIGVTKRLQKVCQVARAAVGVRQETLPPGSFSALALRLSSRASPRPHIALAFRVTHVCSACTTIARAPRVTSRTLLRTPTCRRSEFPVWQPPLKVSVVPATYGHMPPMSAPLSPSHPRAQVPGDGPRLRLHDGGPRERAELRDQGQAGSAAGLDSHPPAVYWGGLPGPTCRGCWQLRM